MHTYSVLEENSGNQEMSFLSKSEEGTAGNISDEIECRSILTLTRARKVQASLSSEHPSIVKLLLDSHVSNDFVLSLPSLFYQMHLPRDDVAVVLEDESEMEFKMSFLALKGEFDGGWRSFSVAHRLVEGDCLVFHLVSPNKFKVYIVRGNSPDILRNIEGNTPSMKNPIIESSVDQSMAERDNLQISGEPNDSGKTNIVVHGVNINARFSKEICAKYYNLCCSQMSWLHRNLRNNIDSASAAEIISRTVHMADAIKNFKIHTIEGDFSMMEKALLELEKLGMDISFIRVRLHVLVRVALGMRWRNEFKRYNEARSERESVEEEIKNLQEKLMTLKQKRERLDGELVDGMLILGKSEHEFQLHASAPW